MRFQRGVVVLMSIAMSLPGSAGVAGQHVVDSTQLAAALSEAVDTAGAQREAIHHALARPHVRHVLSALAIDERAINAAVEVIVGLAKSKEYWALA